MKKIFIPISFCLLIFTFSTAQENKSKAAERKQQMHQQRQTLKKELNLSDVQKLKMKSINEKYREQIKELKNNDAITRGDFKSQMKLLQEKRKVELDATLTVEQKNKIKKIKETRQKEMKAKANERFEKMSQKLNLDEKQKATIKEAQVKTQEKIKSIRENKSITEIQKKEQLKELREKQKIFTKSILSDEQKKKIEHHQKGQDRKA